MAQWIVHWGARVPGSKTPIQARPIVLAQAVSSLPVEPDIYDAVHSLKKKPHAADQLYQLLTRDLFFPNSFLMFIYQLTNIEFLQ